MYSTIKKLQSTAVVLLAIALVGVITPAGAFANSSPTSGLTSTLQASAKHPVMAIPGNNVIVTLPTGTTQVVMNGPKVPQISADALPGIFYLTFKQLRGSTVIDIHDFGILDGNAELIRPIHFDDGSTRITLKAGEKRALTITEVMGIGTGTLRWAPLNHYVADWQFVAETA